LNLVCLEEFVNPKRVPSVLVFVCARMHISAPGHMFSQRHLWTRNGSQVPSGSYVSGYTLVFRITCLARGTCEPTLGSKCLLVCMHPDTLSCSGLHVLCKRCSWTHLGPEQPLRCPKAFVYVAGVPVGPSGPRVTPLPVFMCVPEEFVGPSGPRTPQARPICVCALARVVLCMCVCKHFHVMYACMHGYVCVYACCVCMVHVFMRVCMLCVWVLGGPSGPRVTRACVHACCVFVGARWSFVDPGSPVVH